MRSVATGDQPLEIFADQICHNGWCIKLDDIISVQLISKDLYFKRLIWWHSDRIIKIGTRFSLMNVVCSLSFENRLALEHTFSEVLSAIEETIGSRLVSQMWSRLSNGEAVSLGGVDVTEKGVWVAGTWSFLCLKAQKRFVRWADVRTWRDLNVLHVVSFKDTRFRSQIDMNTTDNAIVLYWLNKHITEEIPKEEFKRVSIGATFGPDKNSLHE